jgi:hypothetical protein
VYQIQIYFACAEADTTTGKVGMDLVGTDTRLRAEKPRDLVSILGGKWIFSSVFLTKGLELTQPPIQWLPRMFLQG